MADETEEVNTADGKNVSGDSVSTDDYRTAAADDLRRRLDATRTALGMSDSCDLASAENAEVAANATNENSAARGCVRETVEFLRALGMEKRKAEIVAKAGDIKLDKATVYALESAVRYAEGLTADPRTRIPNIHGGHRKRLREAAASDRELASFSDIEILETLLSFVIPQRNTNPTAHELLDTFGSLFGVFSASEKDLFE